MHIIRTIIWVVIAVVLVIFAMNNWEPVTIKIWPGWRVLDTKLPALVIGAFLLGLLPMYVMYRASRWSLRRRLESSERSLADLRAMANRNAAAPVPNPAPVTDLAPDNALVPAADPPQPPQAGYPRAAASKG